jgi:hypothetical protein
MTAYIGCDYARARLESLVDGELAMDEQVAVGSHVRWCRTCAARIEDLRLIGDSIRRRSALLRGGDGFDPRVQAVEAGVIGRVCAEHDQALLTRLREQLTDLRLVLPAAGASVAVMLAIGVALAVLQLTSVEVPESLAARLEAMGSPGSERNPLRPDNRGWVDSRFGVFIDSNRVGGISLPRALVDGGGMMLAGFGPSESSVTVGMVVGRDGRVVRYEIRGTPSAEAGYEAAIDAAVQQALFAPAQLPSGRPVAVELVHQFVSVSVSAPDLGPGALLPLPIEPVQQGAMARPHDERPAQPEARPRHASPTA